MATHERLSATSLAISVTTVGVGRVLREVEVGEAELIGKGLCDLAFGGEVEADEYRTQAFARAFVFEQRRL